MQNGNFLMHKQRNFGLDLLRAIAISLVIVSHCTYFFVEDSNNPIILFVRVLGAVGVDLFFVLSGFLIGGLLLNGIENNQTTFPHLITFWKRRWLRTLPNYFLMLLINIFILWLFSKDLPKNIGLYFVFLQNFSTTHPDFFSEAWSLSIEEYAYLILPIVIFSAFSIFKKRKKSIFLWATLFVIGIGCLLKIQYYFEADVSSYKEWSAGFRKVVIYRLNAIYIGFLLVYMMRMFPDLFKKFRLGLFILSLFVFGIVHVLIYVMQMQPQTHLAFYVFLYLPLISLSCSLSFPFAVHMRRSIYFYRHIQFLSTRSYAIYVINFSAILLSIRYLSENYRETIFLSAMLCLCYLILTVVLSNLMYIYFEKPILRYRDKNF